MIKKVYVINKTHLDIGFTDLAKDVEKKYLEQYLPNAVELANSLNINGEKNFVWTTGSWLIYTFLKNKVGKEREILVDAIKNGYIKWHGLAYTSHTEFMNERLLNYTLGYSKQLDKEFGTETIAAKMTDVPGHTIGMINHLAKAGIKYLHIGVNPSSKVPDIPRVFLWKDNEGNELIVNYAKTYGEILELDELSCALAFSHTGDNCGPGTAGLIEKELLDVKSKYKDAEVIASDLNEFAKEIIKLKDMLPVVTEEIGDTWIHGVATDPIKAGLYRELLIKIEEWIQSGELVENSSEYINMMDKLCLVPEHTWGMDLKKYLPDFNNYIKNDFKQARELDVFEIKDIPQKYAYIGAFTLEDEATEIDKQLFENASTSKSYKKMESSWKEQRDYVYDSVSYLPEKLKNEFLEIERNIKNKLIYPNDESLLVNQIVELGNFKLSIGSSGALNHIEDKNGHIFANDECQIGNLYYELLDQQEYDFWLDKYQKTDNTYEWSISDFSKPGLDITREKVSHKIYKTSLVKACINLDQNKITANVNFENEASDKFGCPRDIIIEYVVEKDTISIKLSLANKDANRIPETLWFNINPRFKNPNQLKINKLGYDVSPLSVVYDGNRNIHVQDKGITYNGADASASITSNRVGLIGVGDMKILRFDQKIADPSKGVYFNIFNNVWGTNFPMWFEEDIVVDFKINLKSKV